MNIQDIPLPEGVTLPQLVDTIYVLCISYFAGLAGGLSKWMKGADKNFFFVFYNGFIGVVCGLAFAELADVMFNNSSYSWIAACVGGFGGYEIMNKLIDVFEAKLDHEKTEIEAGRGTTIDTTTTTTISPANSSTDQEEMVLV
jgi:hypothetical protein